MGENTYIHIQIFHILFVVEVKGCESNQVTAFTTQINLSLGRSKRIGQTKTQKLRKAQKNDLKFHEINHLTLCIDKCG